MKCVLLAAGEGRRMRPLTAHRPKVMLPVGGKPILEHVLERAQAAGFDDFVLVVHYEAGTVRKYFGDGRRWGVRIAYVDQGRAGGTGHAVARLGRRVQEPFALLYGDNLFEVRDLKRLAGSDALAIAATRVDDASDYGLLRIQRDRLVAFEEKPPNRQPGWVNAGAYVLTPDIVRRCAALSASPRGEFELPDALMEASRNGGTRIVKCASWRDLGRPWHLLEAQAELMKDLRAEVRGRVDASCVLEGPVVVEQGAVVRHGSVIEGPCIVQRGARVGPLAYLRASTAIGPGCHVGASVEIKNSILMENTHVPHLSYVGDSILGAGVNLGAGTMVANLKHSNRPVRVRQPDGSALDTRRRKFGVVVGDGAKTGINATLNVGAVLGSGARVLPGRLVDGWVPDGAVVA